MNKPTVLCDLDDTLFQTRRKMIDELGEVPVQVGALDRSHAPRSFMNKEQAAMVEWLLNTTDFIPVTARGTEETSRVAIPFSSWKVMTHGAVIARPDGTLDPEWQDSMLTQLANIKDRLLYLCQHFSEQLEREGLNAWCRMNTEYQGEPIYFVMKHRDSTQIEALYAFNERMMKNHSTEGFYIHRNGNNVAWLPNCVQKGHAVLWLLDKLRAERGAFPVLGLGDSLSDYSFMKHCNWFGMPLRSQFASAINEKLFQAPAVAEAAPFHGSYRASDVQFLLQPVALEMTPVEEKEKLIQSGARHYSDMLSQEPAPSAQHLDIFYRSLEAGAPRMAREVMMLAKGLTAEYGDKPIVLVSLVRAGVPLGVMLQRALSEMGKTSCHYGISIIRDRGIDEAALAWIEQRHDPESVVFVDGWTGKGTITGELVASLRHRPGYGETPRLVVLADPAGCAWLAASKDDWLIPFGIMGAPVSGMVSRSIWSETGFHGCVRCDHLDAFECSQKLADAVDVHRRRLDIAAVAAAVPLATQQHGQRDASLKVVSDLCAHYQVSSVNRIKPGIAEATRAVLRRVPDHVLVRDKTDPNVSLLIALAAQKGIEVQEVGAAIGQYSAVTIIRKVV